MNNKIFVLSVFAFIAGLLYLFPEKQAKVSEDIAQTDQNSVKEYDEKDRKTEYRSPKSEEGSLLF